MSKAEPMSIEDACRSVLGRSLADSIIADRGVAWAAVYAIAGASTDDDPRALRAFNSYLAEIREDRA